jgi:hypothetical protein
MSGRRFLAGISLVALTLLAAAVAGAKGPENGYESFAGCPSPEESPAVEKCFAMLIRGGQLKLGNIDIPIEHPLTLSGGIAKTGEVAISSKGGPAPVKQEVPGGVVKLTGQTWLSEFYDQNELKLYATIKLARDPGNPLEEPIIMPIRVNLVSPLLNSTCGIGSRFYPIKLRLRKVRGTLVDHSFKVPLATDCFLEMFGFISTNAGGVINLQSGLTSATLDGTNEAALHFHFEIANSSAVYP